MELHGLCCNRNQKKAAEPLKHQVHPLAFLLTLFRMGYFRAAHRWWGAKRPPLPKIFHTYPAIMKLGTVIP